MIERLTTQFGIPQAVEFTKDSHNLARAVLRSPAGYQAEVLLYGAQVMSWRSPTDEELLFVSTRAVYERGKPIRGGVPLVFPQFSKGELPSHGFARTAFWEVKESFLPAPDQVAIKFGMQDSKSTLDIWQHRFSLELTVTLSDKLHMRLRVFNCDTVPLFFFAGFHPYFRVTDISRMQIAGLQNSTFADLRKNKVYGVQQPEALFIEEETDRAYLNAPNEVTIIDQVLNRYTVVRKGNIKDLVVWNPGAEKSKAIGDLAPHEYGQFVCVEPMIMNQKITLPACEGYELWQEFQVK